jgi:hypothetical protein
MPTAIAGTKDERFNSKGAEIGERWSGTEPAHASCRLFELEFRFNFFPGNKGLPRIFGNGRLKIAQVFELFDPLLESSHGLIERFNLFENGGLTHKLVSGP